jgi:chlorite dismutase
LDTIDIREHGRAPDGRDLAVDRRLFIQFSAFGHCRDTAPLIAALKGANITGALYEDVNDPLGIGLVTCAEAPEFFVSDLRPILKRGPFAELAPKPEFTMLGRTYTLGYEPDPEDTLLRRPVARITNPNWPWAIWYPLRRAGSFERLSAEEQGVILKEHGGVGMAFGRADLAHDIRLACHGLSKDDNDFVIGLVGPQLHPLSALVQRMRKTRQTSLHLEKLGPFFIGRAIWQSESASPAHHTTEATK